ncbi:MAG: hypothetical protein LBS96_08735 [Oscillospiraceae bacterium]|jgi:hypothetical protein|nr:hypothetical protein [Oscillospiraceae bacterium]
MKRYTKATLSILLTLVLLAGTCVMASAKMTGGIYLNGATEPFSGTLAQAIEKVRADAADADAVQLIEIEGTVTTLPIGLAEGSFDGGLIFSNITIQGRGEGAAIALQAGYSDSLNSGLKDRKEDVLTIRGDNVTLKNLTVNAKFGCDFALRIYGDNFTAEDVVCLGGQRGAVNIVSLYPGKHMTLRRVQANSSYQGGFYFDDAPDCSGLLLEQCSTQGNIRVGVLVRNGYNSVGDLDLSGVTCKENVFAVEDRAEGRIGDGQPAPVTILAPPRNAAGNAIDTTKALYFSMESAYRHIRYGAPAAQYAGASASIATERYGFATTIYYTLGSSAATDLREGETLTQGGDWYANSFGKATALLNWLLDAAAKGVQALVAVLV